MDSLRQSHLANVRLLVAEDNVYSMKMIINVLRAFGFRDIFEATNGADALELYWCKQIDLVITDHFMPMYTGADLARHIRTGKDSPNKYTPIVAVTPGTTRMVVEELRDSGVNEIVAKPFTPKDLLQKINATVLKQRPFIVSPNYVGPDRRRQQNPNYNGPERRADVPMEFDPEACFSDSFEFGKSGSSSKYQVTDRPAPPSPPPKTRDKKSSQARR